MPRVSCSFAIRIFAPLMRVVPAVNSFPCFIINPYEEKNTTPGRIETCGPVGELDYCNNLDKMSPPHPCHMTLNFMCEQTAPTCLQGTNANCKAFCKGLLPLYIVDCNDSCDRWCPTSVERNSTNLRQHR